MFFNPKLFREDGAADNGGGNEPDSKNKTTINTTVDVLKPLFTEEEIKGFGFESVDAMKEHLRQQKENSIPLEEKKKQEDLDKANFIKYSTENGLMNPDEITQFESLKNKADRDLVFESFAKEEKEDDPDLSDDEIKEKFENKYDLNSANEKTKARGESKISKEAKELRSPYSSKFENASKEYADAKKMAAKIPEYNKFMDGLVEELTPEKLVLFKAKEGEEEIAVDVDITKEERAAILKDFKNNKNFVTFLDKPEQAKDLLTKKITSFLKVKYFDTVNAKSLEIGKGIGTKQGSTVGANNPFHLTKENKKTETKPLGLEESNDKIAQARQRVRG